MKLCDYCETNLPDDAIHCAECGMDLPCEDITLHGFAIPNPITPIPDMTVMETIPVLHDESLLHTLPALENSLSLEPTIGDVATLAGTPAPEEDVITDDLSPTLAISPTISKSEAISSPDPDVITDDPPFLPRNSTPSSPDLISDDTPVLDTDPNLAEIPSLALADDLDDDPAPANGHLAEQLEAADTLSVMSFAETGEESTVHYDHAYPAPLYPDYGKAENAVPAPLYADAEFAGEEGSAQGTQDAEDIPTTPEPLYADNKATSQKALASTNALMFIPRKISTAYPRLLSARGLIAALLCLALVLSSVGLYIYKNHQPPQTKPGISPIAAKLKVLTPALSSEVVKGFKVVLPVSIANEGRKTLQWTADSGNTSWLSLGKHNDIILSSAPPQEIFATADARTLAVGNYTSAIQIHSNGGNQSIQVSLNVIPFNGKKQPILSVNPNPPGLNFGSVQQGQQETGTIYIGNVGTSALHWNASTITPWVTPGPTSGTILPGGDPVPLTITVNTANPLVHLGFNNAEATITSDAGKTPTLVGISLTMIGSNGNALTISANPGSFTNGCLSCTVILSASKAAPGSQASVHWSTSGIGIAGITFNPSSGTLLANQSIPVTVTVPNTSCPASANFTFTGAANNASVLWSCTPPPTSVAILTASPTSLNNCYTCTVHISPAAGSQSSLNWTSSFSGINGININPPSGTVAAGNSQAVTITVPNTNCPANANSATLTFNGQGAGNSMAVAWSCTPPTQQAPQLYVNPTTLNQSQCTNNNDGTYTCTVTLSENPAGNLSWSTFTGVGGTFSQTTGNFSSGQTQTTITVSNILCQPGSFGFNGPNNSALVQWSCNQPQTPTATPTTPPTLPPSPTTSPQNVFTPNPSSLNSNNCSQNSDGTFQCNLSISESQPNTVNWTISDNAGLAYTITPGSGQLTASQMQQTVNIPSLPCGTNDTFSFNMFTTPTVWIYVSWNCTPPPPTPNINVSPNTIDPTTCTNNNDGTYSCNVSVNESSSGNVSWNASDSLGRATFSPSNNGQLSTSSPSQNVTIILPCMNDTVYFVGTNSNTVQMGWICSLPPSPTPPPPPSPTPTSVPAMLSFSPMSFPNASGCSYVAGSGWTCIETLSVNADATQNLTWNVSASSPDITFSSYGGTMSPGQTSQITIFVPDRFCPVNEFFLFAATNQGNGVYVNWNCNAVLNSYWNCSAITVGSQYQCTITPYMESGGQGKMSWTASTSSGALFQPTNGGTVTPNGNSTTVSVTTGCYDTFTIVGQGGSVGMGNTVTINWACQ